MSFNPEDIFNSDFDFEDFLDNNQPKRKDKKKQKNVTEPIDLGADFFGGLGGNKDELMLDSVEQQIESRFVNIGDIGGPIPSESPGQGKSRSPSGGPVAIDFVNPFADFGGKLPQDGIGFVPAKKNPVLTGVDTFEGGVFGAEKDTGKPVRVLGRSAKKRVREEREKVRGAKARGKQKKKREKVSKLVQPDTEEGPSIESGGARELREEREAEEEKKRRQRVAANVDPKKRRVATLVQPDLSEERTTGFGNGNGEDEDDEDEVEELREQVKRRREGKQEEKAEEAGIEPDDEDDEEETVGSGTEEDAPEGFRKVPKPTGKKKFVGHERETGEPVFEESRGKGKIGRTFRRFRGTTTRGKPIFRKVN